MNIKKSIHHDSFKINPTTISLPQCVLQTKNPVRILIVKLSAIGDVIQTIPVLSVLRTHFPFAKIDWAVEERASNILKGQENIHRLIVFRRKEKQYWDFISQLRKERYDWTIDFQGTYKSGFVSWLSKSTWRIGFDKNREPCSFFYNAKTILKTRDQLPILRHLELLGQLGVSSRRVSYSVGISERDRAYVNTLFEKKNLKGKYWVLNAFSQRHATQWGIDKYKNFIKKFQKQEQYSLILIGSLENYDGHEILSAGVSRVFNLSGLLTLKQTAYVMEKALFSLSGDTGPMHLAVSVGCPVVAIFGSSNPVRTGPFQTNSMVLQSSLECQPCYKRRCPLHHHNCMKELQVDDVLQNVTNFLETKELSDEA